MNTAKAKATPLSKKLIAINRLRRVGEQLLKAQELADKASDSTILTPSNVDPSVNNDLFSDDEATQLFEWAREIGEMRKRYASFANDLQQRLEAQKKPQVSQEWLNK